MRNILRNPSGDKNPNWKGGKPKHICVVCNAEYLSYAKYTRCCSLKCSSRLGLIAQYGENHKKKEKPIKEEKAKYTKLYQAKICGHYTKKGRSYCPQCSPYPATVYVNCVICNTEIIMRRSEIGHKITCSKECQSIHRSTYQKGDKSHRWLGGKTSKDMLLRHGLEYKTWRNAVFERDNYTCQICSQHGGKLCADHIKPWALYPALRFFVDNGRTLCRECHGKQDTTGARLSNLIQKEKKKHGGVQYRLL